MTERPNVAFASLIAATAVVTGMLLGGLAVLGGTCVVRLAATIIGALSSCVFFLAELKQVPVAPLVLTGLSVASALAFVRTLVAYLREQRLLRTLPLEPIEDGPLTEAMHAAPAQRVYVVPASRASAFCYGLVRPRIVITSGLLARLNAAEQAATVWHELHHARSREPLKCLCARLATSTFFWIPALRDLLDRYLLAKELAADRAAIRRTSTRALAGALYEASLEPASIATVGMAELAGARVERLFDANAPLPPLFQRSRLAATGLVLAGLTLLLEMPLRLDLSESVHLRSMLLSSGLHGLPGMAAGSFVNATIFVGLAVGARRVWRRRR